MQEWTKPEIILQATVMFAAIVSGAFAVYYAIKSDLRIMHERITVIKEVHKDFDKRIGIVETDIKAIISGGDRHHHQEA